MAVLVIKKFVRELILHKKVSVQNNRGNNRSQDIWLKKSFVTSDVRFIFLCNRNKYLLFFMNI